MAIKLEYDVEGDNFSTAGSASDSVKSQLKMIGLSPQDVRRVAIAMYEGEINMVIHAGGGKATVEIFPDKAVIVLKDEGPGIKDVELAMQEGYSTASDQIRNLGFGAGMGLPNMKKCSDKMEIDTVLGKGTTITMEIVFSS
ncbi:MAG: ATP-binding protein [Clostridia bacterium]|nr:ATP-binding protein [Clostridia bacterium]MDY5264090.1 ATP-binding protein [Eubacteriales bacterium]MDY5439674.1 ATP-binding protein [Eubacteriales bacterium]